VTSIHYIRGEGESAGYIFSCIVYDTLLYILLNKSLHKITTRPHHPSGRKSHSIRSHLINSTSNTTPDQTSFLGDLLSGKTQGVRNIEAVCSRAGASKHHTQDMHRSWEARSSSPMGQIKSKDLGVRALRKDFKIRELRYVMPDFVRPLRRLSDHCMLICLIAISDRKDV
jgi:hypothetical protein